MSDAITFLLNGEPQELRGISPTTTLYRLLRDRELTGTKEGCAEGDCGACTVAIGDVDGEGRVTLKAVNSCILLAGMLHGRSVTTVEHIAGPGGELHPSQQAMVDLHGSQCGFCTSGFVVSLYVAHANGMAIATNGDATKLLSGNLCRCTGYGPIISAARQMAAAPAPAWDIERRRSDAVALVSMGAAASLDYLADGRRLFMPQSTDELAPDPHRSTGCDDRCRRDRRRALGHQAIPRPAGSRCHRPGWGSQ